MEYQPNSLPSTRKALLAENCILVPPQAHVQTPSTELRGDVGLSLLPHQIQEVSDTEDIHTELITHGVLGSADIW